MTKIQIDRLAKAPHWRWLLNRSDSPWYPTVRLFRQTVVRRWDDVMTGVAAALREDDRR